MTTTIITKDAYVYSYAPTTPYSNDYLYVGIVSGTTRSYQAFIEAPPELAPGETFDYANLVLTWHGSFSGTKTLNIERINAPWTAAGLTWNTKPATTLVKQVSVAYPGNNASSTIDVADVLDDAPYGISITSPDVNFYFYSAEATNSAYRPRYEYSVINTDSYRDAVLSGSPVEYWEFNEASGDSASTGTDPHALTHSGTTVVSGRMGNARQYDGVDDVSTASNVMDFMGDGTYSVECWFKWDNSGEDYPTFIRRDGNGKVFLLRGRANNLGDRPGLIETYVSGRTVWTTTRYDDNQWHHAVVTVNGTTVRLFIDNVEHTSANGLVSTGGAGQSNPTYIGRGAGAGEHFKGALDEFAIYQTVLSPARIAAHYNAGLVPQEASAEYAASAMTGSASMTSAGFARTTLYAAPAMTATASTPTASAILSRVLTPSDDYFYQIDNGAVTNNTALLVDPNNNSVMKFGNGWPMGVNVTTANLKVSGVQADLADVRVYPILADFSGRPVSKSEFALGTPISGVNVGTINLNSLIAQGRLYGLFIERDPAHTAVNDFTVWRSSEATTTSGSQTFYNGPTLAVTYDHNVANISYAAAPMTATGSTPDVSVRIYNDATPAITSMGASASMSDVTVVAEHDGGYVAEAMVAEATMPGGTFAYPVTVEATALTADASMPDASIAVTIGVVINGEPMKASAKWTPPAFVNDTPIDPNVNEDPYYNRVSRLTPKTWWRFSDNSSSVKDAVTGQVEGSPSGVYRGGALPNQAIAPEGRKAVHFPLGAYIEQNEPSGSNQDETTYIGNNSVVRTVLEFSVRTTKANQFVMAGADQTVGANGVASNAGATELFISNGKMGYRAYQNGTFDSSGNNNISKEFSGFANVADGEWHHVVIRSGIKSGLRDEYGVEIWIDGKMDVRRYFTQSWIGMPDFIGGRAAHFDAARLPALPLSQYFEGDMAELVWYADTTLTEDDATRNYYAFFGYRPIEAPAMEATASMATAKGKGNQKKALYLYWSSQDEVFGGMPGKVGQTVGESLSFDPMPGLAADSYRASLAPRLNEETGEFFGYKVFTKSITRNYSPLGVISYRDNVTDEQSLIDLTRDVDLSEYDVIMFKDWPDEGYETDWYEANYPGQKERLLSQLRDANDDGIGLYVTNPRLAVDLGIIDRVEFVQPLTENRSIEGQGRASGLYDYGSAIKFPWDIVSADGLTGNAFATGIGEAQNTTPSFLTQKAYFYYDNNRNNKFRVVAKIPGLTDLPSYMLEDAVFHVDSDRWGWEGAAYKYLHRENGLEIGDEYIFHGAPTIDGRWMDMVDQRYLRGNGTWATPPGHVKAGTVVTTFGSKHYVGTTETTNPYADYATTIVLETGTPLNGRSTGGRIFVNFSETPGEGLTVPVQVLPGSKDSTDNPLGLDQDDTLYDADAPAYVVNGNAAQKALVEEALSRCTFPVNRIKNRIQQRFNRPQIPIVFGDIDPGEEPGVNGVFISSSGDFFGAHATVGVIVIDEKNIEAYAKANGEDVHEAKLYTILHEIAHSIDYVYLQPYQRVNIWNVFHGDWNVYHKNPVTGGNVLANEYILPAGYPLDYATDNIINGEGWRGGAYEKRVVEAFANAFVQAYSDIGVNTKRFEPHQAPEFLGPQIRAAIETGPGAYLFNESQVDSGWPIGYPEETNAQKEWEYSWTRTSLSHTTSALKTRLVSVTLPDGSTQTITQGSTVKTRANEILTMTRSNQLFPVIQKPRLEMTARGIYWLADETAPQAGDTVAKATPMTANGTAPSATPIAQRANAVIATAMTANAQMTESAQAKSGNATVLASPMTADARMSQGSERTVRATPMTATATMPESVSKFMGEAITLRLPRPSKITLRIKEAV